MTTQEPVIVIDKLEKSYGKIQAVRGISTVSYTHLTLPTILRV